MALLGASAVAIAGVQTTPAAAPFPGPLPGRPHPPLPRKKRLKEIFAISGGKLEDVLSCLSALMSVSV